MDRIAQDECSRFQRNHSFSIEYILKNDAVEGSSRVEIQHVEERQLKEPMAISKRARTVFSGRQLEFLELEFSRQQYVAGLQRSALAAALGLTVAQVKVWFQNRRIKWRKQLLQQSTVRKSF